VNEWRRTNRLKRGSGSIHLSLDCSPEEELYVKEPATQESPDLLFERRWARKLVDQALEMVRQDYLRARQVELYEAVMPVVWGDGETQTYSQIAASLGTTEGAFKVAVFRARQRIRDRIRETVASTVSDPSDAYEIDAEMQHLQDILKGRMPNPD
jgi:RNA polymerase sigma-70 factor (ECF subfamily)